VIGRRSLVAVITGHRVMVTVAGFRRGSVGDCGHGSGIGRELMVMVMVMMMAHKWPERFLHHLLKRLGRRCRWWRWNRTDVVLRLELTVLTTATTSMAMEVRRPSGRGRRCRRVLVGIGNGRYVGQRAVGVRAGRGSLQHRGRKRRVRVHGIRPRHGDPLSFVLHPPVLKPHLKSLTKNTC